MIDADSIRTFCPAALDGYVEAIAASKAEIEAAGIGTPLVWSHFISQLAHESGGLTFVREDTRWSGARMKALWPSRFPLGALDPRIVAAKGNPRKLANLAYGTMLGNQGGDDGWLYRGGGLIQLTGRANYRECGQAIDVGLEVNPDAIEEPDVALKTALWFWTRGDTNRFAVHNYGRTVGNAINRGNPFAAKDPIGYQDRHQWFRRAWAIWGSGNTLEEPGILYLGAWGPKVHRLQENLKGLGYQLGAIDGVLGPTTARALAGFKLDRRRAGVDVEPEERVGPLTLAALDNAGSALLSPERERATVATLAAAGSTEVATGQRSQALGRTAVVTAAVAGAGDLGLLDTVKDALGGLPAMQTVVAPVIAAVQWGLRNALWVAVLVGGVWMYVKGRDVVLARLGAHRTGANLGR